MKAITIKVDGSREIWDLAPDDADRYTQVRAAIGGGYVEALRIASDTYLMVDEEGRLKDLPLNAQATRLYNLDAIVGDAVLIGDDGSGEFVGVEDRWLA
jgi:hypothetical protein